jgi:formyltetrahydrofolate deformylase
MITTEQQTATLLIYCHDQKGIVATVTEFIHKNNGNIIDLDQHVDHNEEVFFMRAKWDLDEFQIPREKIGDYFNTLIGERFQMNWQLYFNDQKVRMAIFISKLSHCVYDMLSRQRSGEWDVEIPMIISNHESLKHVADEFGLEFYHFPITKENKAEQEQKEIELLKKYNVDLIVLARYMQVVSADMIQQFPNKIINIHHSFLPAFPGAKPYHSAYERGVKLIGATSHYVTADLDAGPIIAQGVAPVSHKDTVENMMRKGLDLEKLVLAKAVWAHIQRQTLVYNNKTIIFD